MASALNAFMKIGKAKGESKQAPYADWIELQAWEWEVEAETSWTKGGGASRGQAEPRQAELRAHLGPLVHGDPRLHLHGHGVRATSSSRCASRPGASGRKPFFKVEMREAFITKVYSERDRRRQRRAEVRNGVQGHRHHVLPAGRNRPLPRADLRERVLLGHRRGQGAGGWPAQQQAHEVAQTPIARVQQQFHQERTGHGLQH